MSVIVATRGGFGRVASRVSGAADGRRRIRKGSSLICALLGRQIIVSLPRPGGCGPQLASADQPAASTGAHRTAARLCEPWGVPPASPCGCARARRCTPVCVCERERESSLYMYIAHTQTHACAPLNTPNLTPRTSTQVCARMHTNVSVCARTHVCVCAHTHTHTCV